MTAPRIISASRSLCVFWLILLTACTAGKEGSGKNSESRAPLDASVSVDRIEKHLAALASKDDARMAGSPGEADAASYVSAYFAGLGLTVREQEFPIEAFTVTASELRLVPSPSNPSPAAGDSAAAPEAADSAESIPHRVFLYSGSTGNGSVTGLLVDAGLGRPEDFLGIDLRGKIALMTRGELFFFEKARNAAAAGAIGAVICNSDPDYSIIGSLMGGSTIPVVAVSGSEGQRLREANTAFPVTLRMLVDAEVRQGVSRNVTASIPASAKNGDGGSGSGKGELSRFVVIGAHLDSVDTPGANDNGSGLAALMEIARIVKELRLPIEVRCIAFGAEEIGLKGSEKAAESISAESSRCAGMINLDTIGQGETITIYTLPGTSREFAELAGRTADRMGIAWSAGVSQASDHAPFARLGVPAVFLMREPAVYYHTDADTIASVDPAAIGEAVRLAVGIISVLE